MFILSATIVKCIKLYSLMKANVLFNCFFLQVMPISCKINIALKDSVLAKVLLLFIVSFHGKDEFHAPHHV